MVARAAAAQLAQQLEEARNELFHLEALLLEMPELLEEKFRRELERVRQDVMVLQAERQSLLMQAAALGRPDRFAALRLAGLQARGFVLASVCGLGVVMVAACVHLAQQRSDSRPVAPPASPVAVNVAPLIRAGDANSILELEARDSSWIEVTDSRGQLLLRDTLEPGLPRRIRLRQGLRLFTVRPENLHYRIDGGEFQSFPARAPGRWIAIKPRPVQIP